jgi:hypothetical protein
MGLTQKLGTIPLAILTDASNNVGIGAAPSGSYKLEVTGTAKVSSTLLVGGSVTSDDLILTAGTLFGAGNTGFSNRSSDTTLYLQMPATGFNITDNALNTKFILSSAGAATFSGLITGQVNNNLFGTASATGRAIRLQGGSSGACIQFINAAGGDGTLFATGTSTSMNYAFNTYSIANALVLTNAGDMGLGTATPSAKIHAVGINTSSANNLIYLENAVATVCFKVRNDGYIQSPSTYNNTTASPNYLSISTSGFFERYVASSARYKEEIKDWNENGLAIILALKPKTYKYKKEYYNKADVDFLGLIAEEVAEVNTYLADYENEDGTGQVENVRYATIVVPLIKAVQEQNQIIQELNERLNKAGL